MKRWSQPVRFTDRFHRAEPCVRIRWKFTALTVSRIYGVPQRPATRDVRGSWCLAVSRIDGIPQRPATRDIHGPWKCPRSSANEWVEPSGSLISGFFCLPKNKKCIHKKYILCVCKLDKGTMWLCFKDSGVPKNSWTARRRRNRLEKRRREEQEHRHKGVTRTIGRNRSNFMATKLVYVFCKKLSY